MQGERDDGTAVDGPDEITAGLGLGEDESVPGADSAEAGSALDTAEAGSGAPEASADRDSDDAEDGSGTDEADLDMDETEAAANNFMTRRLISTGSSFEDDFSYSRAVVQGDWCFVSGTTGYDYASMTMPASVGDQAQNALMTIARALAEAGFTLAHVVRTVVYLTDPEDHARIGPALRASLGDIRPANTTVIARLMRPEMKVEIEVTAFRG